MQVSMKQNFVNHTPQKHSEATLRQVRPTQKMQNSLDTEPHRSAMVKSKNNSIANM